MKKLIFLFALLSPLAIDAQEFKTSEFRIELTDTTALILPDLRVYEFWRDSTAQGRPFYAARLVEYVGGVKYIRANSGVMSKRIYKGYLKDLRDRLIIQRANVHADYLEMGDLINQLIAEYESL